MQQYNRHISLSGNWDAQANAWVSEAFELTGDYSLEVKLPSKGRLIIKKSNGPNGPWPKVLITPWEGPIFKTLIFGDTQHTYIKVCLTDTPTYIDMIRL